MAKHYHNVLQVFGSALPDDRRFLKHVFQALRFGFESHGIDYEPVIKNIGKDIGTNLSGGFESNNLKDLLDEIAVFWSKNGLGEININNINPLEIVINNCFECCSVPPVDKNLCSFSAGLLEGIITGNTGIGGTIKETECQGNGHNHCMYKMRK